MGCGWCHWCRAKGDLPLNFEGYLWQILLKNSPVALKVFWPITNLPRGFTTAYLLDVCRICRHHIAPICCLLFWMDHWTWLLDTGTCHYLNPLPDMCWNHRSSRWAALKWFKQKILGNTHYNHIYWTNMSWNCTVYFLDARALLLTEHEILLCVYAAHACSFNYKSDYSRAKGWYNIIQCNIIIILHL